MIITLSAEQLGVLLVIPKGTYTMFDNDFNASIYLLTKMKEAHFVENFSELTTCKLGYNKSSLKND